MEMELGHLASVETKTSNKSDGNIEEVKLYNPMSIYREIESPIYFFGANLICSIHKLSVLNNEIGCDLTNVLPGVYASRRLFMNDSAHPELEAIIYAYYDEIIRSFINNIENLDSITKGLKSEIKKAIENAKLLNDGYYNVLNTVFKSEYIGENNSIIYFEMLRLYADLQKKLPKASDSELIPFK